MNVTKNEEVTVSLVFLRLESTYGSHLRRKERDVCRTHSSNGRTPSLSYLKRKPSMDSSRQITIDTTFKTL